jgi:Na+-translocating ferredoxin:NAD+ oxidoreductase RnfD subunit
MTTTVSWSKADRLGGLRRFAIAITLFNLLGHSFLGFEQSWAQPLVALATTYSVEILLEVVEAVVQKRIPHFIGGIQQFIDFLLPAHITGLAVAMLLYANEQLFPIIFASAVAIASKAIFHTAVGKTNRHFFNPSNFGITITLLLFPWVGIAPPYQFTENLSGIGDWLLPGLIVITGTFLNARFTRRLPLIAAWLIGFVMQALLRSLIFSTPLVAALVPMTGVAFILFTFYMVTDPGTTPIDPREQILFGAGVAATYGILMVSHIVFGLFFALTIVCAVRGILLQVQTMIKLEEPANMVPASATAVEV